MRRTSIAAFVLLLALPLLMAPNRRTHDHIGNYNFTVEIEGLNTGYFFSDVSGLGVEVTITEAAWSEQPPGTVTLDAVKQAGEVPATSWTRWARSTWLGGGDADKVRACPFPKDDPSYFDCLQRSLLNPIEASRQQSQDPETRERLGRAYNALVTAAQTPGAFIVVIP